MNPHSWQESTSDEDEEYENNDEESANSSKF